MARVFTILLILVYAFSATGATVHLHYCCGSLQKLTLENKSDSGHDDCPHHTKEEKKKKSTCCLADSCDTRQAPESHCQDIKVDAKKTTGEHVNNTDKSLAKIYPLELLVFTLIHYDVVLLDRQTAPASDNSPPGIAIPLFIQHCTYRI